MKKIISIVLAGCLVVGLAACSQQREEGQMPDTRDFFAMNTYIRLEAYGNGAADALALGAVGKGYASDEVEELLRAQGSGSSQQPAGQNPP